MSVATRCDGGKVSNRSLLQFVAFLERLSRTLNMDELTQDVGIELHTDSIIHRAEQLARLESDKIVDKVSRS